MGFPDPPAFVNHFNIGYDVVGVEADLVVSLGLVVVEGDGCDSSPTSASRGLLLVWILVGVVLHVPSPCGRLFIRVLVRVFLNIASPPCMSLLPWVFIQVVLLITCSPTLILIEFILFRWKVVMD